MNVFVLCTGRNGSTTLIEACKHMTNYSAGHETLSSKFGESRLNYPVDHIEADNRLSWFLGRLGERYGERAAYVHLVRDEEATARSYLRRWESGIMLAYHGGMLQKLDDTRLTDDDRLQVCVDYCRTVNANIRQFLRDKPKTMVFELENAIEDFENLWSFVGAQGDKAAALQTWTSQYNASNKDDNHHGPQSLGAMRGQLREKSTQVDALRAKLEAANQRHRESRDVSDARTQALRAKLEENRDLSNARIQELRAKLETANQRHRESRDVSDARTKALRAKLEENRDLSNARIQELRAKLETTNQRHRENREANNDRILELRTKLETANQRHRENRETNTARIRELRATVDRHRQQNSKAAIRSDRLRLQLALRNARSQELQHRLGVKNTLLLQLENASWD